MRVGSLFSGIGGIDLGLERAGMEVVWQVEREPFCQRVLRKHWPHVALYDDVRTVGAHNLAPVDLIAGGFPCQDISVAGKGAGIEGERSGLWSEFARILDEMRPAWAFIENVPALRSRGLARVLQDLDALGYDAEWHCVPASAVGAPHQRDRIWIIASLANASRNVLSQQAQSGAERERVGESSESQSLAHPSSSGLEGARARLAVPSPASYVAYAARVWHDDGWGQQRESGGPQTRIVRQWLTEPDVGRVAHGVPARVDRLRALGNAVVPQVAELFGRAIMEQASGKR